MIVAIDGPSGSGKSSVSTRIAKALNLVCLNTGMIYRGVALYLVRNGVTNESDYKEALKNANIRLDFSKEQRLFLGDEDVTDRLMENEISLLASKSSKNADVREYVAYIQKNLVTEQGIVAEGRDITTVIFPNAEHKFFLNASYKARAERRAKQLGESNKLNFEEMVKSMFDRDMQDLSRELSPLKLSYDTTYVSSDNKTLDEVASEFIETIKANSEKAQ